MQCSMQTSRTGSSTFGSHCTRSRSVTRGQHRHVCCAPAAIKSCKCSAEHQAAGLSTVPPVQLGLLERLRSGGVAAMLCTVMALAPMQHPLAAQASQRQPKVREELEGPARIVDGDTLWIDKTKIRLFGVDAPETKQSCGDALGQGYMCGQQAASALQQHVGGAPVHCVVRSKDQYGRSVATCGIGRAGGTEEDIGAWMVANGHAVAYRQYSKSYVALEERAHEQGVGVWQGDFTMPYDWRKAQRSQKAM